MQDRTMQCLVGKPINVSTELSSVQQSSGEALPVDVYEMAEMVAGYMDCMEEALRYLTEEEMYPETHPAVQGLRSHLAIYRRQLLKEELIMLSKEDQPMASFKEKVRSILQQLIMEERVESEKSLFQSLTNLLEMSTAHTEFTKNITGYENVLTEAQVHSIKMSCFQGPNIFYSVPTEAAKPILDDL